MTDPVTKLDYFAFCYTILGKIRYAYKCISCTHYSPFVFQLQHMYFLLTKERSCLN